MFTVRDLRVIQAVVDNKIVKTGDSLTAKELYRLVSAKLKTKVAESSFGVALAAEIAVDNIVGIEGKKKVGYCRVVKRGRPKKPAWLKSAAAAAAVDKAAIKKRGRPAKVVTEVAEPEAEVAEVEVAEVAVAESEVATDAPGHTEEESTAQAV